MTRPINEIADLLQDAADAARNLALLRDHLPAAERAARLARLSRCVRAAGAQLAALEGTDERTPLGRACDEIVRLAEQLREAEACGVARPLLREDAARCRSAAEHVEAYAVGDDDALRYALGISHPVDHLGPWAVPMPTDEPDNREPEPALVCSLCCEPAPYWVERGGVTYAHCGEPVCRADWLARLDAIAARRAS